MITKNNGLTVSRQGSIEEQGGLTFYYLVRNTLYFKYIKAYKSKEDNVVKLDLMSMVGGRHTQPLNGPESIRRLKRLATNSRFHPLDRANHAGFVSDLERIVDCLERVIVYNGQIKFDLFDSDKIQVDWWSAYVIDDDIRSRYSVEEIESVVKTLFVEYVMTELVQSFGRLSS